MMSAPPSISPRHLLLVSIAQLVEIDVAVAGIVDVRGKRRRSVRRSDGARNEAGLLRRLLRPLVGGATRELRRLDVHLIGQILHMVIGQRDALRVERIRFDDVGVRAEILAVDFLDDRRAASERADRYCP